jgi:hypothetical protein
MKAPGRSANVSTVAGARIRGWAAPLLVTGTFLALTMAMTYPLSTDPGGRALDSGADTRLFLWTVGWNLHALATPGQPLFDANIFFPAPHTLAYSENLVGFSLLAAPVRALGGNLVLSLNVASLASLALCGLGAFILARQLGLGLAGSFLAGLVFAFAPPRLMRLGQPHQLALQWIPFCLAFVHRHLATGSRGALLLAGAFFLLQATTSGHGALFLSGALALLVAYRWATGAGRGAARPLTVALALLLTALALAALLAPYAEVRSVQGLRRPIEEAELWSPDAASFLASPAHVHRALFSFVDTSQARTYLFPGVLPLLLAVYALVGRGGRRAGQASTGTPESGSRAALARWRRGLATVLDGAAVLVAVLAFVALATGGLRFRVGGLAVSVSGPARALVALVLMFASRLVVAGRVPSAVFRALARAGRALRRLLEASGPEAGFYALLAVVSLWIALGPRFGLYAVLYNGLPGFDLVRVPSRFAALTLLALGLLAGFGLERLARRSRIVGPLAFVLVVGEFWAAPLDAREYAVEVPAIDRWLAGQPDDGAVVELPAADPRDTARSTRLHSTYMLHQTLRWRPLVNGYSGFTPASHDLLFRQLVSFPDERSLDALGTSGVRYAVVHPGLYASEDWPAVAARLDAFAPGWRAEAPRDGPSTSRLRLLHREDDGLAFELVPSR